MSMIDTRATESALKLPFGLLGALSSNIVAIPLSAISARIAVDTAMKISFINHYKEQKYACIYKGAMARLGQKAIPAVGNMYIPEKYTAPHPYLSRAVFGMVSSVFGNFFKILQTQKVVADAKYSDVAKTLLFTREGWSQYAKNTVAFAPNDALRFVICFGVSAEVRRALQIDQVDSRISKLGICCIASSTAALMETIFSFPLETATVVHGSQIHKGESPKLRTILRHFLTKKEYSGRVFSAILIKNLCANLFLTSADQLFRELFRKSDSNLFCEQQLIHRES